MEEPRHTYEAAIETLTQVPKEAAEEIAKHVFENCTNAFWPHIILKDGFRFSSTRHYSTRHYRTEQVTSYLRQYYTDILISGCMEAKNGPVAKCDILYELAWVVKGPCDAWVGQDERITFDESLEIRKNGRIVPVLDTDTQPMAELAEMLQMYTYKMTLAFSGLDPFYVNRFLAECIGHKMYVFVNEEASEMGLGDADEDILSKMVGEYESLRRDYK